MKPRATSQTLERWALIIAALTLIIAACSPNPGITMTLEPASISIEKDRNANVAVDVTRTNFSGDVTLDASGIPTGVTITFDPNPIVALRGEVNTQAVATAIIEVADNATPGNSDIIITATGPGVSSSQQLTLTVTDSPIIDDITIQGYGNSHQVRQGAGDITVEISGDKLANIALASLGTVDGTVLTNDNLVAEIQFTIPHAEGIGPKDLSITTNTGQVTQAGAVRVTAITSAPTGNDVNGFGTPDNPFRSLSTAVSRAAAGDSITLFDGTYHPANGETFPLDISGIRLSGTTEAGTIIDNGATGTDILEVHSGTTRISNLTVQGQGFDGLDIDDGTVTVENVTVKGMTDGGVDIDGGTVTLSNLTANGNEFGVEIDGGASVTATGFTIQNNSCHGIRLGELSGGNQVELSTGTVDNNGSLGSCSGFYVIDSSNVLSIESITLDANGLNGLHFASRGGDLTVTNSTFTNNGLDGIRIGSSPASVNLGDASTTGSNTMTGNGSFQLNDLRADGEIIMITAYGNDLGGAGAPPSGNKVGPSSEANRWNIAGVGNQIDFGP